MVTHTFYIMESYKLKRMICDSYLNIWQYYFKTEYTS